LSVRPFLSEISLQEVQACMDVINPLEIATVVVFAFMGCVACYRHATQDQIIQLDGQLYLMSWL